MMYTYKATIINVIDGDTVDAIIDMGFKIHTTQRLRLNRIDTEEMHDTNLEKRKLAIEAKEYLRNTLLNKEVIIETRKSDSFGRWLAEIVCEDININNVLLEKNLASLWKK
jgi:micrococcal nuclease